MKITWRKIKFEDLKEEKGKFIVITYWGSDRNFLLARVINENQIEEISESNTDRISFQNLKAYFLQHQAYSIKRKLSIVNNGELQINLGSSTPGTITDIVIIDNIIIEEMFKKKLEKYEESIKKLRTERVDFKKVMKKMGLLPIKTRKK